ncbi:MAG: chemotaxis protein CheA [Myxococcales bacterium]|jgi:two-component system chemotaxis sensor kinase CheA
MAGGTDDRAREEFLVEAQELIESLSRDLLLLDEGQRRGRTNPDTLNDLFRGVHTLKGLAGMFGFEDLGRLAHVMEDLLEDLRLGRVELDASCLDLLFEGVEDFQRLLAEARDPDEPRTVDIDAIARKVAAVAEAEVKPRNVLDDYEFDPAILSVLTEYEEHRLRSNLERGYTIYRFRLRLQLDVIDTALAELKERCGEVAEVITYLPSMGADAGDAIDIELLVATGVPEAELRELLNRPDGTLMPIQRRTRASIVPGGSLRPAAHSIPADEAVAEASPAEQVTLRSLTNVVRVDIRKLDYLMNVVGELGTVRNALGRLVERLRALDFDRELGLEAHRIQRSFNRYLGEVQEGVLDVRMVPLSQLFDKLAVIVRQIARDQGKEVQLVVKGAETEVDKLIAEDIADPLMHIVRNAVDHGVETREARAERGKPPTATLSIHALQKGNHVVIEVRDDGRGIDSGAVRETALRKGVLNEAEVSDMARQELLNVIFLPGFSTRQVVTDVSGRGIGMDVVKTNIHRLGGAVEVESEHGESTTFTITLPITLAIISALLFSVRGRTLSIPLSVVQEALKLDRKSMRTVEGREVLDLRGGTLPLCRLDELFGWAEGGEQQERGQAGFVIVVVVGNRRLGLVVDELAGQQDIVIKPLGRSLSGISGISGATDLGDQRLVLVMDAPTLVDEVLSIRGQRLGSGARP